MLSLKKMVEEVVAKLVNDLFLGEEIVEVETYLVFKEGILNLKENYEMISPYISPYNKLRFINESLANV